MYLLPLRFIGAYRYPLVSERNSPKLYIRVQIAYFILQETGNRNQQVTS